MVYDYETADPILYKLLIEYARHNRQRPTEAESVMWQYLRGKQLGKQFRRQHIIGPFIADFACLNPKIVVELDGGYHSIPEQQVSDEERTEWLENKGFKVIRFTNDEVLGDIQNTLKKIKDSI